MYLFKIQFGFMMMVFIKTRGVLPLIRSPPYAVPDAVFRAEMPASPPLFLLVTRRERASLDASRSKRDTRRMKNYAPNLL
jgi:hypothetical protein